MQIRYSYILVGLFFLFSSCEKEDPNISDNPVFNYFTGYFGNALISNSGISGENLILCGSHEGVYFVSKISLEGEEIWRNDFHIQRASFMNSIVQAPNGDLYACATYSYETSSHDKNHMGGQSINKAKLLVKLNSEGDTLWTKSIGDTYSDNGNHMLYTSDDKLLVIGRKSTSAPFDNGNVYLKKIDLSGEIMWTKEYVDIGSIGNVIETNSGDILLTGTFGYYTPAFQFFCSRFNSNGDSLYTYTSDLIPSSSGSTIELANGDLVSCGRNDEDIFISKHDYQGNLIWRKIIGEPSYIEIGGKIKQDQDGTFTISGAIRENLNESEFEILLIKVDENGELIWRKQFPERNDMYGWILLKDYDDNNIILGSSENDFFMTKLDSDGNFLK